MLETSKDLLVIVFAFCILWFTVFLCWAMYYFIVMLRDFSRMTSSFREKLDLIDNILNLVKRKLEKSSDHLSIIADGVIKLVTFLIEKKKETGERKRTKKE